MAKKKRDKRKEIKERIETLDFEGDLAMTVTSLRKTMYDHRGRYIRFEVEKETEYDYGYNNGYTEHYLYGIRLETDEEFKKRIDINEKKRKADKEAAVKREANKEAKELAQYEKLHEKYKDKI